MTHDDHPPQAILDLVDGMRDLEQRAALQYRPVVADIRDDIAPKVAASFLNATSALNCGSVLFGSVARTLFAFFSAKAVTATSIKTTPHPRWIDLTRPRVHAPRFGAD